MTYQRDYAHRLRTGLVGIGSHAYRNILPALHFLPVQLVAFCDADIALARATAPEYGVTRCYARRTEMIAEGGLDAVLLCVGERHHPDLACEALDAGLHVWMEKPAPVSSSEVERMLRHRGDRVCAVGMKKAFMPATRKVTELMSDPRYAPIRSILGVYSIGLPTDGNAILTDPRPNIWTNACHPLAFMLAVGGLRAAVTAVFGDSLRDLVPGSPKAAEVKAVLQAAGLWSQYLEVGIGPDAEVFTKAQPMSTVGWGASVGLHPVSKWNNPEPEVVLAVDSTGRIVGATLENDVNLRDVEGRSALLLGKAKDNNAAASLGPFIRLFDAGFTLNTVRNMELTVTGLDGFALSGRSSMSEISRDPADLVAQTRGRHHQYPDGFMLYCGTMFSPVQDRDGPGQGFTHDMGDVVTVAVPELGCLTNTVRLSTEAPEWTFGARALMTNLAARGLL